MEYASGQGIREIKNHKNVIMMSATIDNWDYIITEKEAEVLMETSTSVRKEYGFRK